MPARNAPRLQALVMDEQRNSNGWQTFFEHWGLAITVVVSFLAVEVLEFFTRLSGAPWIWWSTYLHYQALASSSWTSNDHS